MSFQSHSHENWFSYLYLMTLQNIFFKNAFSQSFLFVKNKKYVTQIDLCYAGHSSTNTHSLHQLQSRLVFYYFFSLFFFLPYNAITRYKWTSKNNNCKKFFPYDWSAFYLYRFSFLSVFFFLQMSEWNHFNNMSTI